ncbi:MAG: hypothetical protein J0H89_02960 [Rhizobiales bacterium]|nr:hypothetical protein [Hyphomicrobiales bacterium]
MVMTVAQVDAIVKAAPAGEIVLPEYQGLSGDLDYLRTYVLAAVTARYNVDASVFDTANLLSTTILRDFLHRAVYDHPDLQTYQDLHPDNQFAYQTDVGALFREEQFVQCGIISWQLQNIYQSLGYDSVLYNTINGEDGLGTVDSYNDGHVRVEVKLDDYDKWITQDATYNWLFQDATTGAPLSYREAQILDFTDSSNLIVDDTGIRTYVGNLHIDGLPPGFMGYYLTAYMKGAYGWLDDGVYSQVHRDFFLDFKDAHTEVFDGAYAAVADAVNDVVSLHAAGKTLVGITDALRADHQVSGFRLLSLDEHSVVGDYVTLQMTDGNYVSINIDTGETLNGSYDQIYDDLTGGNRGLNPGVDVSEFFNPAVFVLYNGDVQAQWDVPQDNPLAWQLIGEHLSRITVTHMPNGEWQSNYWDAYDTPYDHIQELYKDNGIYWRTTEWDNGNYSVRPYDYDKTQPFTYFEWTWDHTGQLISKEYVYDDGTSSFTTLDPGDQQPWAQHEQKFDAAHNLVGDNYQDDKGGWTYTNLDVTNKYDWATWKVWTDPSGATEKVYVTYDDGHVALMMYDKPPHPEILV